MQIIQPTEAESAAGIRAMVEVGRAAGALSPAVRNLIAAAQRHILHSDFDVDALQPIAPEALASAVQRLAMREQLINAMVIASFADGVPAPAQAGVVERFAGALGVQGPQLSALRRLAAHERALYVLCILRNGHMPDMLRDIYRHHGGVAAVANALMNMRGITEDRELAARYHALERLPDDRLGKRFWHHYHDHGFAFPGQAGGFPETGVYHDFSHVLAGYNTSPEGETVLGGFIAGYRDRRPDRGFFTLLFVLSIFSVGIDVTPISVGARTGTLGQSAGGVIEAIRRGGAMSVDLSDNWDHWAWVDVPVDEARRRLGIAAKVDRGAWDSD